MPGQGSYGEAGKWIHDRAHRIMESDSETPKHIAYAIATQQAHKVGKSPKDFRTPQGVREARQKYDAPRSEYQKTAMMAGFFDELEKISQMGIPTTPGMPSSSGMSSPGASTMNSIPDTISAAQSVTPPSNPAANTQIPSTPAAPVNAAPPNMTSR
jgi:hypothetical protein